MHTKTTPLFFVLIFTLTFSLIFLIPPVKATSYEWVQNAGFEDGGGNAILDYSFEGTVGEGGMWLEGNPPTGNKWGTNVDYQTNVTKVRTGVRSVWLYTYEIHYNVTNLGAPALYGTNINNAGVYAQDFAGDYCTLVVYAVFETAGAHSQSFSSVMNNGTWQYCNFTDLVKLHPTEEIIQLYFVRGSYAGAGVDLNIDDVILGSSDIGGQDTITLDTEPWKHPNNFGYVGINQVVSHTGVACAYIGYEDTTEPIYQEIDFLDSNTVTNFSMWLETDDTAEMTFRAVVVYSDRSSTAKVSEPMDATDGWVFFDCTNIILPQKVIIQIQLRVSSGSTTCYSHFDDISLLASVPFGQGVFSWELSPSAIENTNTTFSAYQGVGYVFTGYVYNTSGYVAGAGTFSVSHSLGTTNGVISGGVFSFTMTARTGINDLTENFVINIISNSRNITVSIIATWVYVGYATPTGGAGGYDSWYSNIIVSFMVFFIFIIVPPLIIAVELRDRINPAISFVAGLALTVGIGYMSGLVPLWMLFTIIIVMAVMLLAVLRGRV